MRLSKLIFFTRFSFLVYYGYPAIGSQQLTGQPNNEVEVSENIRWDAEDHDYALEDYETDPLEKWNRGLSIQ